MDISTEKKHKVGIEGKSVEIGNAIISRFQEGFLYGLRLSKGMKGVVIAGRRALQTAEITNANSPVRECG